MTAARRSATIRFPERLHARIVADAERCGRRFHAQVVAILRRHYGEDVDIAPETVLALALESFQDLSDTEIGGVTRRLVARDEK